MFVTIYRVTQVETLIESSLQFTYFSIINQISGRTPSDATQYPIFRASNPLPIVGTFV
jgi:hypothetical protein